MQAEQPTCKRCHKPVPPDATRCPHCGYTIIQQTPTTMVREQEQRTAGQARNRTLTLILIAVIVIIILIILYLIFSGTLGR